MKEGLTIGRVWARPIGVHIEGERLAGSLRDDLPERRVQISRWQEVHQSGNHLLGEALQAEDLEAVVVEAINGVFVAGGVV